MPKLPIFVVSLTALVTLLGCNVERFEDHLAKPRDDGRVITAGKNDQPKQRLMTGFGSTRGGFGSTRGGFGTTGSGFGRTEPVFRQPGFGTTHPLNAPFGTTNPQ